MLPELIVIATAFLVLLFDLVFLRSNKKWLGGLALVGILIALLMSVLGLGHSGEMLGGRFGIDPITSWFKVIFLLAGLISVSFAMDSIEHSLGEFCTVLLFTLSGMMFLASSRDLVSLYVSLELATIPLFVLAAWPRTARAGEGAIKYVIVGALASAFLLYGLGLLYGLTGQTSFVGIASALSASPAMWLAAGLISAGIGFKLTLFPFHMWAPDVYEGSPTVVTAYLSVASKAAGLMLSFHLFYRIFGAYLAEWGMVIAVIAAATMTLGNVVAILQNNVKRFMAYSAISQAGYLILGFLGTSAQDVSAMVFYMLVYVVTNLAAFAIIILHVHQTGNEDISSFRGLSKTNPLLALALMVALFGLAGIPPLSGFVGKFFLFIVAAKAGYYWLVALAAVNSTVSLYYYLRIVRQMYIEPPQESAKPLVASPSLGFGLVVATIGSVFLGVVPVFYEHISENAGKWASFLSQ